MALRMDRSWSVCGLALSKCRLVVFEWMKSNFRLRFSARLSACKFLEIGILGRSMEEEIV